MKLTISSLFLIAFCSAAMGAEHLVIDTLGSSAKGQYVAVEEYGYKADAHTYYAKVMILNVWKSEYVGKTVEVSLPANRPVDLEKARAQVKDLAQDQLKQFNIKG